MTTHGEADPELLSCVPLFSDLSEATLLELRRGAIVAVRKRGYVLFKAGDRPQYLHVLMEGTVQLSASTPEGRDAVVELLRPVDAFIMAAVLTSQPYLMTATAIEPVRLLLIPGPLLLTQLMADPRLGVTMLSSMARQYRKMVQQVKDLRLRTATQRLGIYLLRLAQSEGNPHTLILPYDKKLVAARLDMKPESLSRAICALREHGVIVESNMVQIADMDRLRAFCSVDHTLDRLDEELGLLTGE